jgi:hypothetical protein
MLVRGCALPKCKTLKGININIDANNISRSTSLRFNPSVDESSNIEELLALERSPNSKFVGRIAPIIEPVKNPAVTTIKEMVSSIICLTLAYTDNWRGAEIVPHEALVRQ